MPIENPGLTPVAKVVSPLRGFLPAGEGHTPSYRSTQGNNCYNHTTNLWGERYEGVCCGHRNAIRVYTARGGANTGCNARRLLRVQVSERRAVFSGRLDDRVRGRNDRSEAEPAV